MARCIIELPSVPDVLACLSDCEPFRIADCDAEMHKHVATEQLAQMSTPIVYYRLDRNGTTWDPVYNEPVKLAFRAGLPLLARVQKPERQDEAGELGQKTRWDAVLWLAVTLWPNMQDPPRKGDVVGFWNDGYFRRDAVNNDAVPGAMNFYDVTKVDTDGHVNDTPTFVAWEVTLIRRSEFTPERRINELVP